MTAIWFLKEWVVARIDLADDRGEVTEKVILVAIFAGLAIASGAVIVAKVMGKAEAVTLD